MLQLTRDGEFEFHNICKDPFSDLWVASTGDSGADRFFVSTDDGETWSRDALGFTDTSQGLDFGEDWIYIAQDQGGSSYHGPWVVRKQDVLDGAANPETRALCSVNPRVKWQIQVDGWIEFGCIHDRETGVTYIRASDVTNNNLILYRVPHIGADLQPLSWDLDDAVLLAADGYVATGQGSLYTRFQA